MYIGVFETVMKQLLAKRNLRQRPTSQKMLLQKENDVNEKLQNWR